MNEARGSRTRPAIAALLWVAVGCGTTVLPALPAAATSTTDAEELYAETLGYEPGSTTGSLWHIAEAVGAHDAYRAGYTGRGVGIALIDTGLTEVPGLDTGNVVHGPDLSFDSQDPELQHHDAYGHGTHLGSIIAGRETPGTPSSYADPRTFNGIAPDADLLSVKVGASDGAVDVSQVIAALDWVVAHRNDNGMNIRVINLSYGTDSVQDPMVDPLAFAVQQAWKAGIVVVTAAGNDGSDRLVLAQPAQDPTVLAVGAVDTRGTVATGDDIVPEWATRGTDKRHVDLVAPGVSVLGLRVPNGYADERNEQARVGTRFARASGTSQAAAVVSGAAALLLQAQPGLSPDQVKGHLMSTADNLNLVTKKYSGKGRLDVAEAAAKKSGSYKPARTWGDGSGSLEQSRGSAHVYDGAAELRGEIDIFGNVWDGSSWAALSASGAAWSGGDWRGFTWSGDGWSSRTWRGVTWSMGTWSSRTWRTSDWASRTWRDGSWTGDGWTSRTWRDASWSSRTWRSTDLVSAGWLARTWG